MQCVSCETLLEKEIKEIKEVKKCQALHGKGTLKIESRKISFQQIKKLYKIVDTKLLIAQRKGLVKKED
jgi:copper chaperone CopZ